MEARTFLRVILMMKCQFFGKPEAWPRVSIQECGLSWRLFSLSFLPGDLHRGGAPCRFVEQIDDGAAQVEQGSWQEAKCRQRGEGQPHGGPELQGLGDEHALHEGQHHGDEPLERAGPPIVQAIQHGEEDCHALVAATSSQPIRTHHQGRPRGVLLALGELQSKVSIVSVTPAWLKSKCSLHAITCVTLAKLLDLSDPQSQLKMESAAIPEKLPCTSYSSSLWNVKTGENNPWTGSKATLYSKQCCKANREADIMKIKDVL